MERHSVQTWHSGTLVVHIWDTFDTLLFGVIRDSFAREWHATQKRLVVERNDIWESGTLVTHIWGTFDLAVLKVILRSGT